MSHIPWGPKSAPTRSAGPERWVRVSGSFSSVARHPGVLALGPSIPTVPAASDSRARGCGGLPVTGMPGRFQPSPIRMHVLVSFLWDRFIQGKLLDRRCKHQCVSSQNSTVPVGPHSPSGPLMAQVEAIGRSFYRDDVGQVRKKTLCRVSFQGLFCLRFASKIFFNLINLTTHRGN